MKSKKKLIISMVVLALATVVCLISGVVSLAAGGVKAIEEANLPEKLAELDIDDFNDILESLGSFIPGTVIAYNDDYDVEPQTYTANNYDIIVIEDVSCDINVIRGTGEISYSGKYPSQIDKYEFVEVSEVNQNELNISTKNVTGGIHLINTGTLTVSIPLGFDGEIIIRDCAGNIKLESVDAKKLTLESAAGDIKAEYMGAEKVVLDCLVGDVDYSGSFYAFEITDCLGDIDMETHAVINEASIISDCLGDIEVNFAENTVLNVIKSDNIADVDIDVYDKSGGVEVEVTDNLGAIHFDYN